MTPPADEPRPRRWTRWVAPTLAALVGGTFGFEFGRSLAGPWLGVVTAVNGALICSLLADAGVEAIGRWRRRRPPAPPA